MANKHLKLSIDSIDKLFVAPTTLTLDLMTPKGMASLKMSPRLAEEMVGLVTDALLSLQRGNIPSEGAQLALADVSIRGLEQMKSELPLPRKYELTLLSTGGSQFRWRISQEKAEALALNILGSRNRIH